MRHVQQRCHKSNVSGHIITSQANKFNTGTSPTSQNTFTSQIPIPKLAIAPPASAGPEAHSMPPPIDSANRRRYKITFSSQYLLFVHASKQIHNHRRDCRAMRKISHRCKGHLCYRRRRSIVYNAPRPCM